MNIIFKTFLLFFYLASLFNFGYASADQLRYLKKSPNSHKLINPKSSAPSNGPLTQRLVGNTNSISGQSFFDHNLSNINQRQNRPEANRTSIISNNITNEINNLMISPEEPVASISRDLIGDGSSPQIAQQEDGTLWVMLICWYINH